MKQRKTRYIISIVMWAASLLVTLADTATHHSVRVGFYDIPGWNNQSASGERSGYGYDFLQLLRRYVNIDFVYSGYDLSWAESLTMLAGGEIDMLTGALRTAEREKEFDYSYPIGSTDINIYVRNKDLHYSPKEYATFDGMRIGTVASEILDERIKRLAERKKFRCKIVQYADFESMMRAIDAKEIDAMCAIGTHKITGYRILESFDHENVYVIVKKGNDQLLSAVDAAIMHMDQDMPLWTLQLYQDNYMVDHVAKLEFTDEELAYISKHSTMQTAVKIATDNTWRPYSWCEDGTCHGILVEIVDRLMRRVGLCYEFVQGDISSDKVLRERPEVDLYTCYVGTNQYAEENNLVVSPTVLSPSIAIISLKNYDQIKVVGLAQNTPMLNKAVQQRYDYDFVTYATTDELLEALSDGEVDGAIMYDYVAQTCVNADDDTKMQINFMPELKFSLNFVSRGEDRRELISIVSKTINTLTQNQRNNIATKYLAVAERPFDLWQFIKNNPWAPLLVLFIILSWCGIYRLRRIRREQKQDAHARKIAEDANDAKTSFLFNMSHDIRTPMNAIIGFRDLLEKHQDDPDKRADYLRKIEDASMVLLSIINNVLEMARIEKGTVILDETAWSVEQFSDSVYSIFIDMMDKKGLRFTQHIYVEHQYFYCDTIKLREVFINLLSNAYKYTPEGEVRMQIDEAPSDKEGWLNYKYTISDTGMGMSADYLPHLFEEFSRENNTTEVKIEGTGLGMPIVKRLVHLMNGTIEVESEKGKGTTFVVTVPHRIADRSNLAERPTVEADPAMFEGKRILLAEDNDLNAEIAIEILGEKQFVVERAADGTECVEMLSAAAPDYYDLILMDIQMPNMNGYEATRAIRALADTAKANIPIIAMTANAFEEDKRDAKAAGMNGHLAKPIDMHELLKTLSATFAK